MVAISNGVIDAGLRHRFFQMNAGRSERVASRPRAQLHALLHTRNGKVSTKLLSTRRSNMSVLDELTKLENEVPRA